MKINENKQEHEDIYAILKKHDILAESIELFQKNNRVTDYRIDRKFILRCSKATLSEQSKLESVQTVSFVPKIHASGEATISNEKLHYLLLDYIAGEELYSVLPSLTHDQSKRIGKQIAQFLNELHKITNDAYDIGHYIPTIPKYKRSWKEGHLEYVDFLKKELLKLDMQTTNQEIILSAFTYIESKIDCLDPQTGPRCLHNDLHPKNIIVQNGALTGIIDWECSQYGEADFELTHLFQWCIIPPHPDKSFDLLLRTVFENTEHVRNVPNIKERLTIYQLEHELNQLIWSGTKQEERIRRIEGWLNEKIGVIDFETIDIQK